MCLFVLLPLFFRIDLFGSCLIRETSAQTLINEPDVEANAGAMVLVVGKNSEAERAGLRQGDVILGWNQANKEGSISSPLELAWAERELAPRGVVSFRGKRGAADQIWILDSPPWGISPGPNWPELEAVHVQMREYATARQLDQLKEYCRLVYPQVRASLGARSWVLFETAYWLSQSAQCRRADEFYDKAVQELPPILTHLRGKILSDWAELYKQHNDWLRAEQVYSMALIADREVDESSLAAGYDLFDLAQISFRLGKLPEAELFATRALHIRRKLSPNSLDVSKVLNYLGVFAMQRGNLDFAEDYLRQGLKVAESLHKDSHEAAFAYNNLGALLEKQGDLSGSEKCFLRDLEISSRLNPQDYLLSFAWSNLGSIAFQRANLARAQQYYLKALAIQEKRGTGRDRSLTLANLANVLQQNGQLPEAEKLLREALEIQNRASPGSVELAQTIDTLGSVLQKQGRVEEARQNLSRALALRQANSLRSLEVAESLQHLGELSQELGGLKEAEDLYTAAINVRTTLAPRSASLAESLFSLGAVERAQNRLDSALAHFEKGIVVLESQSVQLGGVSEGHLHFHSKYAEYYSQYVSLLMNKHKVERAFEVLERSRAQTLLQVLAEAHINLQAGVLPALLKQERKLQISISASYDERLRLLIADRPASQVAAADQKITDLLMQRERTIAQIRSTSPRYSSLTHPRPLSFPEIQRLLDGQTLLLEYSLTNEHSYVFAMSRSGLSSFQLPKRPVITNLAHRVRLQWAAKNSASAGKPLNNTSLQNADSNARTAQSDVSSAILGPVATLLKGYRRLIIVGDGPLRYIPFAGLPIPNDSNRRDAAVPLVAEHEIVNLPSATILALVRQKSGFRIKHFERTLTIVADPVFSADDPRIDALKPGEEVEQPKVRNTNLDDDLRSVADADRGVVFTRLLYSRREANAIAAVVPKEKVYEALDFEANRTTMTNPSLLNSRILHFATHSFFDSRHPELSGLVFSLFDKRGDPQAGFFGLEDVFNSRLSADLVVLSACQTALGEDLDGEGLIGLTWGFMYAGAKTVVASLWNVDDAATAELMRLFYDAMERKGMPPDSAMRSAQLTMSHGTRWSSPYYWAGFIVQGDWSNPENSWVRH